NVALHRLQDPVTAVRVTEVEVCWDSKLEGLYQVQYRSELTTNAWVDLLGTNVSGTGATLCIPDRVARDQARRFYRVIPMAR
ncbi:MAG TPA: hypothetical protein VNH84_05510, partial [Candidatus Saccharimonadales bacterium]|nr:hypothetical protein [Candidatus Saccharimonadales bacterium]